VHNADKELVHCKKKIEVHLVKSGANVGAEEAGGSDREVKASKSDGCRTMDSSMIAKLDEMLKIIKELKNGEGESQQLKQLKRTVESMKEEMIKIRQDVKTIAEAVEEIRLDMISTIRKEMRTNFADDRDEKS